jgi:uncharacterized protein (DUF2141 family)
MKRARALPASTAALAAAFACVALAGGGAHAQPAAGKAPVEVTVHGLRNAEGSVRCALFAGPDGFPRDKRKIRDRARAPIRKGQARCVFSAQPAGDYAVSLFHDEDDDGKLKTGTFGIPKEGYGFSNDARPRRMSPPRYDAARFDHGAATTRLRVKIVY